jgi:hypothetical protein
MPRPMADDEHRMTAATLPDWVVCLPPDWPVPDEVAPAAFAFGDAMWCRVRALATWQKERRAWLAEHAPHLEARALDLERRRRFPVVFPSVPS